jgi:hypothetical protein
MTPIDLQQKLSAAFPARRWIAEPLAQYPTCTSATTGNTVIVCKLSSDEFKVAITKGGNPWAGWKDERKLEEIFPILGAHIRWLQWNEKTQTTREKAIARK